MEQDIQIYATLFLLIAFLIPFILFFLTQQRLLALIRPENRHMRPGQVWLQLIPVFGTIYQFIVIRRIANSINNELSDPVGDTILSENATVPESPTYKEGISYAILFCVSAIPVPLISGTAAFVGLGAWIWYWVKLSQYKSIITQRSTGI